MSVKRNYIHLLLNILRYITGSLIAGAVVYGNLIWVLGAMSVTVPWVPAVVLGILSIIGIAAVTALNVIESRLNDSYGAAYVPQIESHALTDQIDNRSDLTKSHALDSLAYEQALDPKTALNDSCVEDDIAHAAPRAQ